MGTNIGYHTRARNGQHKIVGGSFGGSVDQTTIERLVKSHFTVKVLPSGHTTFVDKAGREIFLYLTVDPSTTEAGKAALAEYRKEQQRQIEAEKEKEKEIQDIIDSLSTDELLKRLRG